MERRSFLKLSCGLGAGILLSSLGVSVLPIEAFAQELTKYDRIKTAKQSTSICCYCAVHTVLSHKNMFRHPLKNHIPHPSIHEGISSLL